jgi:hypothetical protein
MTTHSLYDLALKIDYANTAINNVPLILNSTQSSRPSTAQSGTLHIPTDGGYSSIYNGTSWDTYVDGFKCSKPPLISTLSGVNISSVTTYSGVGDNILVTQYGSGGSGDYGSAYLTALPSPPYKFEIGFESMYYWHSAWGWFGIGLFNGKTTSVAIVDFILCYGASGYPTMTGGKWNNISSWNSAYFQTIYNVPPYTSSRFFLRFRDDGVTRYYENSADGNIWNIFYSVGRTDFTTPTYCGIKTGQSTNVRATTDKRVQVKVFHWYLGT